MCNGENVTRITSYDDLKSKVKEYSEVILYLYHPIDDIFELGVDLKVDSLTIAGSETKVKIITNPNPKFICKTVTFDNVTLAFDGDNITFDTIFLNSVRLDFSEKSKLHASKTISEIKTLINKCILSEKYEITDDIPPIGQFHLESDYFAFDFDCPINMTFSDENVIIQSEKSKIFIHFRYKDETIIRTTLTQPTLIVTNVSEPMFDPTLKLYVSNTTLELTQLKVNSDKNSFIKLVNSKLILNSYDFPKIISHNSSITLTNKLLSLNSFEVKENTQIICQNNSHLSVEVMITLNANIISHSLLYLSVSSLNVDSGELNGSGVVISNLNDISNLYVRETIINIPVEMNDPLQYTFGFSEIYMNKIIFKCLRTPGILLTIIRDPCFVNDKEVIQEFVNSSVQIIEAPNLDKIEYEILFEKSCNPFDLSESSDPWTTERVIYDTYVENNNLHFKLLENPYNVYAKFVYSDDKDNHGYSNHYLTSLKDKNWYKDITGYTQAVAIYVFDEPSKDYILEFPDLKDHKINIHFFGLPNSEKMLTLAADGQSIQNIGKTLTLHSVSVAFKSEIKLSLDEITIYDNLSLSNAIIKDCKMVALAPTAFEKNSFKLEGLEKINITTKAHDMRVEIGDEFIRAAVDGDELRDLPPFPKYEICYIIDTFSVQKMKGTNGTKKVNIRSKTFEESKTAKVLLKDFDNKSRPIYFDFPISDDIRINTNNYFLNVRFGTGRFNLGRENLSLEIPPQNITRDRLEMRIHDFYRNVSIHGPELAITHSCNLFIDEKISFDNVIINGSSSVLVESLNANNLLIDQIDSLQLVKQLKVKETTFRFSAKRIPEIVITDSCDKASLNHVTLIQTEPITAGRYQIVSSFVDLPHINISFKKKDGNFKYSVEYQKRSVTFVSEEIPGKGNLKWTDYLILGVVSLAVIIIVIIVVVCLLKRNKKVQDSELSAPLMEVAGQP